MENFEQENSQEFDMAAPTPRLFEEFFGHKKASKPDKAGSGDQQENSLAEGVKKAFDYLDKMPDGSEVNPALLLGVSELGTKLTSQGKTLLDGLTSFGQHNTPEKITPDSEVSQLPGMAKAFLEGVTISKHGNRVKITRDREFSRDLNQELPGGKIKIKSLNFREAAFDLSGDADSPHLKNIEGLTLTVEIGGSDRTIDIKDLALSKGEDGKLVLKAEIEHPVESRTRPGLFLPDRIPLSLTLGADGMPQGMKVSDALNSAAYALGYGPLGLTVGNILREAAREAKFAEEHPEGANGSAESLLPKLSIRDTPFEQNIQTGFFLLKTLPDDFKSDPRPLIEWYESLSGQELTGTAKTLLHGVTNIGKHGDRIEITRDGQVSLAVNEELLGGAFKVNSLDLGSTGFDLALDTEGPRLSNITGLSLSIEIAGKERTIAIKDVALRKNDDGKLLLDTVVDNPLPWYLRYALGLGSSERIPISLVLGADGQVEGMKIKDALNTAAEMTGAPGLRAAAKAVEIVEEHPELAKDVADIAFPVPALILRGVDDPSDLAELALRATPVGAAYKVAETVVEHSDEVLDVAGDVAETAFYLTPVGMVYDLFD